MKKTLALLLALLTVMITPGSSYASVSTGSLSIGSAAVEITAGTMADAQITIINTAGFPVYDVLVVVSGIPAYVAGGPVSYIDMGASVVVNVTIDASSFSSAQYISAQAAVSYKDSRGTSYSATGLVSVNITDSGGSSQTPPPAPTAAPDMSSALRCVSPASYVTARPGQAISLNVTHENTSRHTVSEFTMSPGILVDFKISFESRKPATIRSGNRDTFVMTITPSADVKPGTYNVPYTYSYEGEGKSYTGTGTVIVKIEDVPKPRTTLIFGATNLDKDEIYAGDRFNVFVEILNISEGMAELVDVTVSGFDASKISLIGSDTAFFPAIEAGGTRTAGFNLAAAEKLAAGSYPIKFSVRYKTESGEVATVESSFYIDVRTVEGEDKSAVIEITDITLPPGVVGIGERAVISVTLTNTGSETAKNIRLTGSIPTGLAPVTANTHILTSLSPGASETFTFSYTPEADAKTQSYLIGFTPEYETGEIKADGSRVTATFTQYSAIEVARDDEEGAELEAVIASPSGYFGVGDSAAVAITLTNTGARAAKNIRVTGTPPTGVVPTSANIQTQNELLPGESVTLTFSYMPNSDAKTQTYTIGFNVDYETGALKSDGSKEQDGFSQYIGLNVRIPEPTPTPTPPGQSKSTPKVILSQYLITSTNEDNPRVVLAGQEFDLYLKVKNTHPDKTVKNITVSLSVPETSTAAGNVFTPVNGSNSFYIDEIKPGEEFEHTLRMHCLNNAVGRNYVIKINFSYEDEEGNTLTAPEEVGVTVRQVARMEFGVINFPSTLNVGEQIYFSFSIRNTGYVTLRNLKINAVAEGFNTAAGELIIGNFTSGSYDYYDAFITAEEPGEHTVRIVATYDLDTGEHIEYFEEGIVTVAEAVDWGGGFDDGGFGGEFIPERPGMGGPETGGETGFLAKLKELAGNVWVWVGVGAVLTVAVVLIVRKISKKNKQDIDLED